MGPFEPWGFWLREANLGGGFFKKDSSKIDSCFLYGGLFLRCGFQA